MHNVTFPCLLLATHSKSLDHEIGGKKKKKKNNLWVKTQEMATLLKKIPHKKWLCHYVCLNSC